MNKIYIKQNQPLRFGCPSCDFRTTTPQLLKEHYINEHKNIMSFDCPKCHISMNNLSAYYAHLRMHTEKDNDICVNENIFLQKAILKVENDAVKTISRKWKHTAKLKKLANRKLYEKYKNIYRLKESVVLLGDLTNLNKKYVLVKDKLKKLFYVDTINIIPVSSARLKYKCDRCGDRFKDYFCLEKHRETHEKRPNYDEVTPAARSILKKQSTHKQKLELNNAKKSDEPILIDEDESDVKSVRSFICKYCSKVFKHLHLLVNHMETHKISNIKDHACTKCSDEFETKELLNDHLKDVHNVIACKTCPQMFYSERNYEQHYQEKHTDNNRWKCELCLSYVFKNFEELVEHNKKYHSRTCGICKKEFATVQLLAAHRKNDHCVQPSLLKKTMKENPYQCKICDKRFADCYALGRHARTHNMVVDENNMVVDDVNEKHECDLCLKTFDDEDALEDHITTHFSIVKIPGIKSGASTSSQNKAKPIQGSDLQNKIQKEAPPPKASNLIELPPIFKCTLCNKLYTTQELLNDHLKNHIHVHQSASNTNKGLSTKHPSVVQSVYKNKPPVVGPLSHNPFIRQRSTTVASTTVPSTQFTKTTTATTHAAPKLVTKVTIAPSGSTATTPSFIQPTTGQIVFVNGQQCIVIPQSNSSTPAFLPISQFMQPSINQTIVLPSPQNNSQISINQTYNAVKSVQDGQQTNIIYSPISVSGPDITKTVETDPTRTESPPIPKFQIMRKVRGDDVHKNLSSFLKLKPKTISVESMSSTDVNVFNATTENSGSEMPPPQVIAAANAIGKTANLVGEGSTSKQTMAYGTSNDMVEEDAEASDELVRLYDNKCLDDKDGTFKPIDDEKDEEYDEEFPLVIDELNQNSKETEVGDIDKNSQLDADYKQKIFVKPLSFLLEKPADSYSDATTSNSQPIANIPASEDSEDFEEMPETMDESMEESVLPSGTKIIRCESCKLVFKRVSKFEQHKNKFNCKKCIFKCCRLKNMDKHYRIVHHIPNRCASCELSFPTSEELKSHKMKLHLCTKCNRNQFDLSKHKDSFKCTNCDFASCNSAYLDVHYKVVHHINNRCAPCNLVFYNPDKFKLHKDEIHFCSKCRTYKMDLNIHQSFCKGLYTTILTNLENIDVPIIELGDSD